MAEIDYFIDKGDESLVEKVKEALTRLKNKKKHSGYLDDVYDVLDSNILDKATELKIDISKRKYGKRYESYTLKPSEYNFLLFPILMDKNNKTWKDILRLSIQYLQSPEDKKKEYQKEHLNGIDELNKYYDEYREYEKLMYGGNKYYRDHIVHVFRVWLLGILILFKDDSAYENIKLMNDMGEQKTGLKDPCPIKQINGETPSAEDLLAMWTVVALTHDLGYPLEAASGIFEKTKEMARKFVRCDQTASLDLSFDPIQSDINNQVIRLMSSKMYMCKKDRYTLSTQNKYYTKLKKSLEENKHGVLSAILLCNALGFFLESDYSMHNDYVFSKIEAKNFYIKREILRAISTHTCKTIYFDNLFSLSFVLLLCDDLQDWGRKRISDLYFDNENDFKIIEVKVEERNLSIKDRIEIDADKYKICEKINEIIYDFERATRPYVDRFLGAPVGKRCEMTWEREYACWDVKSTKNYFMKSKMILNSSEQTYKFEIRRENLPKTQVKSDVGDINVGPDIVCTKIRKYAKGSDSDVRIENGIWHYTPNLISKNPSELMVDACEGKKEKLGKFMVDADEAKKKGYAYLYFYPNHRNPTKNGRESNGMLTLDQPQGHYDCGILSFTKKLPKW